MAEFVFADDYRLESGRNRSFYEKFITGLVHKNNNLMGAVQGFGSLLLAEEKLPKAFRESIEQMDAAARSASNLNRRVLTAAGFARVDMGPSRLTDMYRFFHQKAETICRKSGVTCQFNTQPKLPPVMLDTQKFSEIFEELVLNAAEAAALVESKNTVIDFFSPGEATNTGNVDVFIRNTSPEIYPHRIETMFEGFHTTKGSDHFGIGLTIAAVLCGQMRLRLGLSYDQGIMTTWMSIPTCS